MNKRDVEFSKARYKAQSMGGEVEDYIDERYGRGNRERGSWNGYGAGEASGGHLIRQYDYLQFDGEPYLSVQRTVDNNGKKQFPQYHWSGTAWKSGKPKGPKIPYMLPELVKAPPEEPIFITEGEKDAETLMEFGLVATTASEGAGKWTGDLNKWFEGRTKVYIFEDNDDAGRNHARDVARNLTGIVKELKIISLPGLKPHEDVSDWVKAGGTRQELLASCIAAPFYVPRPLIRLKPGELAKTADLAEQALLINGIQIYHRGEMLVRPVVEEVDASHGRKTKTARLIRVDAMWMRDALSRAADFERYDKRSKAWVVSDPPLEICSTILSRVGQWTFPKLVGVITTPTMRPDGSLLSKQGYDAATSLLLFTPPSMPDIPDKPTRQDALKALETLKELLAEFPFADEVARAGALSALVTPVVRGAFPVAPMHVTRAPVAGSGKSYLNDIPAAIAIGQPMPVKAAGRTEEETEKRLGAAVLDGDPLVSIDNVNGVLRGDALCQFIERSVVNVRILGKSEQARIEARGTTFFATGNNVAVADDLCRRVIMISLDPQVERPELREFKRNPVANVLGDRGSYIAAALVICRAYIVAGRPHRAKPLGSFEGWSDTVRSALIWLGCEDPVKSMEQARAEDPVLGSLREVLQAWAELNGTGFGSRLTLKAVMDRMHETDDGSLRWPRLNSAVQVAVGARSQVTISDFAQWAKRNKERIVDDLRLMNKPDPKGGSEWWVASMRKDDNGKEPETSGIYSELSSSPPTGDPTSEIMIEKVVRLLGETEKGLHLAFGDARKSWFPKTAVLVGQSLGEDRLKVKLTKSIVDTKKRQTGADVAQWRDFGDDDPRF